MARTGNPARILTSYYRPKPGGLCKRLYRAIEALLAQGHEVHYLSVVPFPIHHRNCYWHRFPWPQEKTEGLLFWLTFHLLAPQALLFLALRHRVTHTFAFATTYALCLQPVRALLRVPLTLFLRADAIENHRILGRPTWLIQLEQVLEGLALYHSVLYGVSESLTRTVLSRHRYLTPACSGVLRNDIPPANSPEPHAPPRHPLRLASVGTLEPRKGQALLIHCASLLPAGSVHLSLYGTGPDELALRALLGELGVGERVTLPGWLDASRIWPEVDLLLMPSLHEGAPNAALEAISHAVPVLASDLPEHREILDPESLLPPHDIGAWQHRLAGILAEGPAALAQMALRQATATSHLRFDWSAAVAALIAGDARCKPLSFSAAAASPEERAQP